MYIVSLITILLLLQSLQAFASPEEVYGAYDKDGKYRAMQEQVDQIVQRAEEAEREKSEQKTIAMWAALFVGLVPLCYIGKRVVGERTWQSDPKGAARAIAVGLAGAALLFALNYGFFLLKIEYGSKFSTAIVAAFTLTLIAAAIYVLRKK